MNTIAEQIKKPVISKDNILDIIANMMNKNIITMFIKNADVIFMFICF
jgi:uncharacterized protein YjgD (DUF1641 family)